MNDVIRVTAMIVSLPLVAIIAVFMFMLWGVNIWKGLMKEMFMDFLEKDKDKPEIHVHLHSDENKTC